SIEPSLVDYITQHLGFVAHGKSCMLNFGNLEVTQRIDGTYAWLSFTANCPTDVGSLDVSYRILDGVDPSHRGLLRLSHDAVVQTAVLGGKDPVSHFSIDRPSPWRT